MTKVKNLITNFNRLEISEEGINTEDATRINKKTEKSQTKNNWRRNKEK
jgi:hypothetical protein